MLAKSVKSRMLRLFESSTQATNEDWKTVISNYGSSISSIKLSLKLNFLSLSGGTESGLDNCENDMEIKNVVKFKYSSVLRTKAGDNYRRSGLSLLILRMVLIILFIFNWTFIIKSIVQTLVHFSRDRLLLNWSPRVNLKTLNGNSTASDCSLNENNLQDQKDVIRWIEIKRLNELMQTVGDAFPSVHGIPLIETISLPFIQILFFHVFLLMIHSREVKSSLLAFMLEPEEFDRKTRFQINWIIDNIMYRSKSRSSSGIMVSPASMSTFEEDTFNLNESIKNKELYFSMLEGISNSNSVEPINVSKTSYKVFVLTFTGFIVGYYIFSTILVAIVTILQMSNEIAARVNLKLNKFQCLQFIEKQLQSSESANFSDIDVFNLINPQEQHLPTSDEFDKQSSQLYMDYLGHISQVKLDVESSNKYNQLFYHELGNYWTTFNVYQMLEYYINVFFVISWLTFHSSLNILSHYDSYLLLNQVNQKLKKSVRKVYDLNFKFKDKNIVDEINEHNAGIYREATIAYILFELFRHKQREFKPLENFLVFSVLLLCAFTLVTVFLIGTYIKCDSNRLLLILGTIIIGYLNTCLFSIAILSTRIESIRVSIMRLLAQCKFDYRNYYPSHVFYLWKRHLIGSKESHKIYSTNIFELHLTYTRILTIDVYLFLLWVVLLQK